MHCRMLLSTMQFQAVIFDLFGTLVENWPVEERRSLLVSMAEDLSAPFEGLYRVWDDHRGRRDTGDFSTVEDAVRAACQSLEIAANDAAIRSASSRYSVFARRCLVPREDAVATMQQKIGRAHV